MSTAVRKKKTKTEVDENHPLADLVPDTSIVDEYINREIFGVDDFDFLDYMRSDKMNTLFIGDTQCGKSMLVSAYAASRGIPLVTINAHGGCDPSTFFGINRPGPDGTWEWQESTVAQVIRYGGILFVDEFNFLLPRVASALHPLADRRREVTILERGNEVIKADDDFMLIAAMNFGYQGTRPLNEATRARFLPVELDYDPKVEKELLCMPVTMELASKLREARKGGTIAAPIGTGMLIEFEEMAANFGVEAAIGVFLARFDPDDRASVGETIGLVKGELESQTRMMIDPDD